MVTGKNWDTEKCSNLVISDAEREFKVESFWFQHVFPSSVLSVINLLYMVELLCKVKKSSEIHLFISWDDSTNLINTEIVINSSYGCELQETHINLYTKQLCPSLAFAVKAVSEHLLAELLEFTCLGSLPGPAPHCLSRIHASRDPKAFIFIWSTFE